jgi:hypothetical protein
MTPAAEQDSDRSASAVSGLRRRSAAAALAAWGCMLLRADWVIE